MEERELYDQVCKVLTWYEHPEESPLTKEEIEEEMYSTLVKVQNEIFCKVLGF